MVLIDARDKFVQCRLHYDILINSATFDDEEGARMQLD